MAILDFLKKDEKSAVELKEPATKKKIAKKKPATETKKISASAYQILKSPHISEKATDLNKKDQYTFKVWPQASKTEIKRVLEELYGVDVVGVKIIKVPGKKKRVGRNMGIKKGFKKAIVRIKKGQKIEILAQ